MCPDCRQRPRAVAYHKYHRIYYRSRCSVCLNKSKKKRSPDPRWKLSGYKKKTTCDRCGFRAKYAAQLMVFHVDGNLNNSQLRNLRTVCQNCVIEINRADLVWRPGDLEPDL
jgi:hypothetical protein